MIEPVAACCASMSTSALSGHLVVAGTSFLLGGVVAEAYPPANGRAGGAEAPAFAGDVAAFVAAANAEVQLYNLVKKCGGCGKVCAVSMADCNGCGQSLAGVAVTRSNNVFMGFIHGIAMVSEEHGNTIITQVHGFTL